MTKCTHIMVVSLLAVSLAACGTTRTDRASSGAGIGALSGAVGSWIIGSNPITTTIVGAVAGGGIGAATKKKDIDLGEPAWNK